MEIRPALEHEAVALTSLARRSKASWRYPEEWLREWKEELRFSEDYLKDEWVRVVELEGEIVGVVALEDAPTGPELAHLWVDPDHQGKGVGRLLVDCAMNAAKRKGWTSLRVLSDPFAQEFYEKMGAIKIGDSLAPVAGTDRSLPVLELPISQ